MTAESFIFLREEKRRRRNEKEHCMGQNKVVVFERQLFLA